MDSRRKWMRNVCSSLAGSECLPFDAFWKTPVSPRTSFFRSLPEKEETPSFSSLDLSPSPFIFILRFYGDALLFHLWIGSFFGAVRRAIRFEARRVFPPPSCTPGGEKRGAPPHVQRITTRGEIINTEKDERRARRGVGGMNLTTTFRSYWNF